MALFLSIIIPVIFVFSAPYTSAQNHEVLQDPDFPVLPLGSCSQSSVHVALETHKCNSAITNALPLGNIESWRCSHVGSENGWWSAKTSRPAHITKVRIFNRVNCCQERLNDFVISVDGVVCARHKSNVTFLEKTFDCVATGQEVKISSNMAYLTLCKVEVHGAYVYTLLPLISCSQSSLFTTLETQNCNSAITNALPLGNIDHKRCSHVGNENGWWSAKTSRPAHIKKVRIFNRVNCCQERLNDFVISVDGVVCARHNSNDTFLEKTFDCVATGQEVKISSNMAYLTLCKVEVYGEYVDTLLPLIGCHQSSVFGVYTCINAIVSTRPVQSENVQCSHVGNENGWWSATTTRPAHITKVRIFNRVDCCQERLNDFVISVDGVDCARHKSNVTFLEKTFDCVATGREVKISSNRVYLTLCKVDVFGEYVDTLLSLIGCHQSSVEAENTCTKAIVNTLPIQSGHRKCSHVGNENGWWSATITRPAHISKVRIFNRLDCCQERLNDFVISVDGVECARHKSNVTFLEKTFDCVATGREVKISSNRVYLTLCKVEVFGEYVYQRSATFQHIDSSCSSLNAGLMGADWHVTVASQSQCEKRCREQLHCKYYGFRYQECTLSGQPRNMNFRKAVEDTEKCMEVCYVSERFCMFHRRLDKDASLNKSWTEYEAGFGDPDSTDFWFGLRWLNKVTSKSSNLTFRVQLMYSNETQVAQYSGFVVGNASQNYALNYQSFDAGSSKNVQRDLLLANKGSMFSTTDRDNDNSSLFCSNQLYAGAGWWFGDCTKGNLTADAFASAIDSAPWYGPLNLKRPQVVLLIQKPE